MAQKNLVIKGAREHNLKNIDIEIPRDKLVVLTGLSGSGKTSLAFDTIYAEGQRRYVESLSSYARQFLGQMEKPDVDSIEGLSPAISIDQKTTSKNPRSTVGTVTEIYDYLRLLYARVGIPHCPVCGREISMQTVDDIVTKIMSLPEGTRIQLMAPIVRGRKGEYVKELESARKSGFVRARADGIVYDLSEDIVLDKNKKHTIEIIVDRLVIKSDLRSRLADSVETAANLSGGLLTVDVAGGEELHFSQNYACPEHGISIEELSPRMFSFNNPFGACKTCAGLGIFLKVDPDLVIPDKSLSLRGGAIKACGWSNADGGTIAQMYYEGVAEHCGFSVDTPIKDLPKSSADVILYGTKGKKITLRRRSEYGSGVYSADFEGVVNNLERRYKETSSDWARAEIEQYMTAQPCRDCGGARLNRESLSVTVGGVNIHEFSVMPINSALEFLASLKLTEREEMIAHMILKEIKERLTFLVSVGLDYLSLSRSSGTLSGGESQRIRLATQIGSSLMGVLYILDEPSIGLHQSDNAKLLNTLMRLRDAGNTLIIVEHDEETMYAADHIVDIGPGAGIHGGHVVCEGTVEQIKKCKNSLTGQYLSGEKKIPVPQVRRSGNGHFLEILGACENNLKDIDVSIPLGTFVCVTGVSGSGKSSLAFNTIYAEGQRRYVESLSSYARQFLGQMEKPDVDMIEGLSPAISIDQKTTGHNPRSTVGTVTEINDYLRLLFARVGIPHCPKCGDEIKRQTVDQIVDRIMAFKNGAKIQLLAPVVRERKGEHLKLLDEAKKSGYVRVRADGLIYDLSEDIKLEKNKKHTIEIVVDRLIIKSGIEQRLAGSAEGAMGLSGGLLVVDLDGKEDIVFSQNFACPRCGVSIEEVEPRFFSFNNPSGACPDCTGLGFKRIFDIDMLIPDASVPLSKGAITVSGWNSISSQTSMSNSIFSSLAKQYNFSLDTPFEDLDDRTKNIVLYGTNGEKIDVGYVSQGEARTYRYAFEGIIPNLERRYRETSAYMRSEYENYMSDITCQTCGGRRLKPEVLAITVDDKNIAEVSEMTITEARNFFGSLKLGETHRMIAAQILKEIKARTGFLCDVGLEYLTLSRGAGTLSGGEAQRIRLATQIGSGLVGVVYILDEPSIGLHQRDNDKLLKTLRRLRDLGNTLIVVEHDTDTMLKSDFIVDIGPLAGEHGGEVVFAGKVKDLLSCENSLTSDYLSGRKKIEVPAIRKPLPDEWLVIKGAAENNLKNIDVRIPLGLMTCVTGVSGSGKSSLINEIVYKRLARDLNRAKIKPGKHKEMKGMEFLDKIINIDQSPIGRTPRSNPATYTGLFDLVRDVYAQTSEAKIRGYQKGRFSFNVKGGRCEACSGDGIIKIEMHFLPDVYVPCEVCKGKRYNRETLEVKYKGKNISDCLEMTIEEALEFFKNLPRLREKLQTLYDVGLSYVRLGQSSTTLSGGEAQRVKLATELSRKNTGRTIYVLDEPTTGLHTADVHRLVDILKRLAEGGNTVVVIEHNLDIIKTADYIIDLGPEGGNAGGQVIARGTPEEVAESKASFTGLYLKKEL